MRVHGEILGLAHSVDDVADFPGQAGIEGAGIFRFIVVTSISSTGRTATPMCGGSAQAVRPARPEDAVPFAVCRTLHSVVGGSHRARNRASIR